MLPDYLEAVVPTPTVCLGEPLRPLALGHLLILHRFRSGFVTEPAATWADLLVGVYVCRLPFAAAVEGLANGDSKKWAGDFGKRVRKFQGMKPRDEIRFFQNYVTDGSRLPKFWSKDGDAREAGSNMFSTLRNIALSELNYNPEKVNDAPFRELGWDVFVWLERQGTIRLYSETDVERKKAVEEFRRKHPEFA